MSDTTLALIGDVMLGRGVNEQIGRRNPGSFWGDVLPVLTGADAVIANLECAITTHQKPWANTYKVFHFGAKPEAIDVLKSANIQCVNLANNHILDFAYPGLHDTLDHLDRAGISRTGAGRDLIEARQPAVFDTGGLRIAVIGLTDNEPPFAATDERGGTFHTDVRHVQQALHQLDDCLETARNRGAEFNILSLHWGPNMVEFPPEEFRRFARGAVDRGVHLIHGHSAHVFQGIEIHNGGVILYDTGDFLDDYAVIADLRNDWSFVFLVDIRSAQPAQLRLVPVRLTYAKVNHARGEEFDAIRKKMIERCRPFATPLRETGNGLEVDIAATVTNR